MRSSLIFVVPTARADVEAGLNVGLCCHRGRQGEGRERAQSKTLVHV